MALKLAHDLMQGRYTTVLRRTLESMLLTLPVMLALSYYNGGSATQTVGVALLTTLSFVLYLLSRTGRESWVAPLLVLILPLYTIWDIVAYGSVRSTGTIGFTCAVVAAGVLLRRRYLVIVAGFCIVALSALTWAETQGIISRKEFPVGINYLLTQVACLLGIAVGVATNRLLAQRALHDLADEIQRRESAETGRRKTEDQLKRIIELSPSGIMVQSVATRAVIDVNPAFERIFGYPRSTYIGEMQNDKLWVEPGQRSAMFEELMREGRIENREVQFRRRDGSVFKALLSSEIGGEADDRIIVSTVMDISAEASARDAIRRSEELFSKAFNFSPMNMTITRVSNGEFIAINGAEDSVLCYSRAELLGRTGLELGVWAHEEDRLAFIERLQRDGQVMRMETQMRHKAGHLVDCAIWAVIVEIDGEPCVLSCTLNISEEKRREAVLLNVARGVSGKTGEEFFGELVRNLASALRADLVMIGELAPGQVVRSLAVVSDGAPGANFSYSLVGTPCDMSVSWGDVCTYDDRLQELFPHDRFLIDGQYNAYIGMALRDADGTPIGILNALWREPQAMQPDRDALVRIFASRAASELIRLRREREILRLNQTLEQRVAARTAELQATNAELESFAYSVSHDLQTPLRGIDGFTALLGQQLEGTLTDEQKRMFGRVRINVARMGDLIADLLGLAKVSKREMHRQTVDLSELASAVAESAAQAHPERAIDISVQPGLQAECDRSLARIALENLVSNAIKYTRPRERALIEIGALPRASAEPLVLYIRDNGVGFDMSYADKLFKPFTRLHHESEFEGSGIGLATVHRILERHGGGITGHAALDHGATFYFSFETQPRAA